MTRLNELRKNLKRGSVYRRAELVEWSRSIDRHLEVLDEDGTLEKLYRGMYYFPRDTAFGNAPAEEDKLVGSFLKDDRFLIVSPNAFDALGVGTTQLYNMRIVYNYKRHGNFKIGNRSFSFRVKPHFPKKRYR